MQIDRCRRTKLGFHRAAGIALFVDAINKGDVKGLILFGVEPTML